MIPMKVVKAAMNATCVVAPPIKSRTSLQTINPIMSREIANATARTPFFG